MSNYKSAQMKNIKIRLISKSVCLLTILIGSMACRNKPNNITSNSEKIEENITEEAKGPKIAGLALYTVRDAMAEDAGATLKAVADAGYINIEAAGYEDGKYYNMSPNEFKSIAENLGLNPLSTHQASITLENAGKLMADAKAAGFKYFVIPVPPMGMFEFNPEKRTLNLKATPAELAEALNKLGVVANENGLKLLYHNHDFELKKTDNDTSVLEYLLENCNPEYVNFQMDLYWVIKAGEDPVHYFQKYPGRFKSWHVKDMDREGRFAPVGQGTIDFKRILNYSDTSGLEYYMVEQDMTFDGQKPMEAIQISGEALKEIGFN